MTAETEDTRRRLTIQMCVTRADMERLVTDVQRDVRVDRVLLHVGQFAELRAAAIRATDAALEFYAPPPPLPPSPDEDTRADTAATAARDGEPTSQLTPAAPPAVERPVPPPRVVIRWTCKTELAHLELCHAVETPVIGAHHYASLEAAVRAHNPRSWVLGGPFSSHNAAVRHFTRHFTRAHIGRHAPVDGALVLQLRRSFDACDVWPVVHLPCAPKRAPASTSTSATASDNAKHTITLPSRTRKRPPPNVQSTRAPAPNAKRARHGPASPDASRPRGAPAAANGAGERAASPVKCLKPEWHCVCRLVGAHELLGVCHCEPDGVHIKSTPVPAVGFAPLISRTYFRAALRNCAVDWEAGARALYFKCPDCERECVAIISAALAAPLLADHAAPTYAGWRELAVAHRLFAIDPSAWPTRDGDDEDDDDDPTPPSCLACYHTVFSGNLRAEEPNAVLHLSPPSSSPSPSPDSPPQLTETL